MTADLRSLLQLPAHARFVVATLLAGILVLLLAVAVLSLRWFAAGSEQLRAAEPRYSRLAGLDQSVDILRRGSEQAKGRLAELTYPASEALPATEASAQQQLRGLLEAAGMQVSGSQLLEPVEHDGFLELRLELKARGTLAAFESLLVALPVARPTVLVRAMDLTRANTRRREPSEDIVLSLSASVVKLL